MNESAGNSVGQKFVYRQNYKYIPILPRGMSNPTEKMRWITTSALHPSVFCIKKMTVNHINLDPKTHKPERKRWKQLCWSSLYFLYCMMIEPQRPAPIPDPLLSAVDIILEPHPYHSSNCKTSRIEWPTRASVHRIQAIVGSVKVDETRARRHEENRLYSKRCTVQ